ncbi:hypothetical protein L293_1355 [Acinetobacter gyllenbergii CIP 110306 = MTCC 11365]|nr:hypothetical protein L293_1355 [Acinetobacter gyllenbergii CIP 110306 = MTCC 11365]
MFSFKTYQHCYYTRFLNAIEVKAKPLQAHAISIRNLE